MDLQGIILVACRGSSEGPRLVLSWSLLLVGFASCSQGHQQVFDDAEMELNSSTRLFLD